MSVCLEVGYEYTKIYTPYFVRGMPHTGVVLIINQQSFYFISSTNCQGTFLVRTFWMTKTPLSQARHHSQFILKQLICSLNISPAISAHVLIVYHGIRDMRHTINVKGTEKACRSSDLSLTYKNNQKATNTSTQNKTEITGCLLNWFVICINGYLEDLGAGRTLDALYSHKESFPRQKKRGLSIRKMSLLRSN